MHPIDHFCCQNKVCPDHGQRGQGNLYFRGWSSKVRVGVTRLPLFDFTMPVMVYGKQGVSKMAPRGTTSKYHPRWFPPGALP